MSQPSTRGKKNHELFVFSSIVGELEQNSSWTFRNRKSSDMILRYYVAARESRESFWRQVREKLFFEIAHLPKTSASAEIAGKFSVLRRRAEPTGAIVPPASTTDFASSAISRNESEGANSMYLSVTSGVTDDPGRLDLSS